MDITKHKWSESHVRKANILDDGDLFIISSVNSMRINKDDAIAIAKHFGLIPDPITWSREEMLEFRRNFQEVFSDKDDPNLPEMGVTF